ncbi:hypothetical protein GJAV_G00181540 [Gymnothorax javanicus]|nr:hypothetical protein GJAV_G00181540 [Gymnothorax javanicus]
MSPKQQWQAGDRWSSFPLSLLLLILLSSLHPQLSQATLHIPPELKMPPSITDQPKSHTAYRFDGITLACNASGNPPPTFRWVRNNVEFDPTADVSVTMEDNAGTLILKTSRDPTRYEGTYRCYASNILGTAISDEAQLVFEDLPALSKEKKVKIEVEEGHSVVLPCNPPFSNIRPSIHWMDTMLTHIQLNERITIGLDGRLYFANVIVDDNRSDYTCNAYYVSARTIRPQDPISLIVKQSNDVVSNRKPTLLSPTSDGSVLAIRGKNLTLECIPEGLPTPTVQWVRKDGTLSISRTSVKNFGRWLTFEKISEHDDGEYECRASNSLGSAKHLFTVHVEAAPYWTKQPKSDLYAQGETVRLHCDAKGTPNPNITWSMNGEAISGLDSEKRRRVDGGTLILKDVKYGDTAVYQCQATNIHGTILLNTHIYVISLPPKILTQDQQLYKVTEGQTALLKCKTFGSPRPKVEWVNPSGHSVLSDSRMAPHPNNGSLQIVETSAEDAGLYTCSVVNSSLSITAELLVFTPSVIQPPPESQQIRSGKSATITCHASIDHRLEIEQRQWRKSGQKLMESSVGTYRFEGDSLIIPKVTPEDEGRYTCEVMTSVDMAQASASITVVDRPDPPRDLQVTQHQDHRVTLRWVPGSHHNSPILEFIVESEEQRFREGKWEVETQVQGEFLHVDLHPHPYSIYRFRVKAVNELGESDPSSPSEPLEIPPAAPTGSPQNVTSDSNDPDKLVITWEEMEQHNFNGPGFKYKVMWKRRDEKGSHWHHAKVEKPPHVVPKAGTYTPFMVKVQAVNDLGEGPVPLEKTLHSGEDVPLSAPSKVHVEHLDTPDKTSSAVRVKWEPLPPELVRGKLLGYKIHLLWLGHRSNGVGHMRKRKRERREMKKEGAYDSKVVPGSKDEDVVRGLQPYSHYNLTISAFNSKGYGPRSEPKSFSTPEGVPERPASLTFHSATDTELTLNWTPPAQVNGVLRGYLLQYQEIQNDDSPMQVVDIDDPNASHFTLRSLNPQSRYRFYLHGRTAAGDGPAIYKDAVTWLDGVPPSNISMSVGDRSVNLSWVPGERHRNVQFSVQYQRNIDGSVVVSDTVNSSQSFHTIKNLEPGTHYNLSIIFNNLTHWTEDIKTEGPAVSVIVGNFATQGWFIGLISAIVLLLLILLILCFIKRSKGGKYSVKDKEEGQVDSEARPMKDDTFGEYSDNEEKRTVSQPSLCADSKLGSDDSLAEYGDSVDIQFNEDGSFIGQYSGHRDGPGPGGPDSSGATSPINPSTMGPPGMGLPNSITGLMGRGN